MALIKGLSEALAPARTLMGFDGVLFGGFRDFESIAPDVRRTIYLDPTMLPRDVEFVAAHMAVSTIMRAYPRAQYVTVLREPHSRILSHWLYWRTQSDDSLKAWGEWGDFVRRARRPLAEFLSCRDVACHVDNLCVRMLLWPHRLIPNDDFIATRDDDILLEEATARLQQFACAELIENPDLQGNLESWVGRPFTYGRVNETAGVPAQLKTSLDEQLTPQALDLLNARGRLDLQLWLMLAKARVPALRAENLRERTLAGNLARYAGLLR
jgi:hypothetical protein